MTRKTFFSLCWLLSASCLAWAADAPKLATSSTFFPLSKGTTWAYRGPVEWQVGTEVKKRVIFWTMEVIDIVEAGGVLAARIKGHPDDMIWYEESKAASQRTILWNGTNYYSTSTSLMNGVSGLLSSVSDENLILPFPLERGIQWGNEDLPPRDDWMYSWVVEKIEEKKLPGIKGVDPDKLVRTVLVTYRCLGSHEFIEYAEGIGIIRYQFGHHGTVSECDMKLVEFRPGK